MTRKLNYFFTPVYALPENTPFKRIGIIPYFIEKGEGIISPSPHFFLMLDSKFQELTDCGGLPKSGETWLETAIRETEEESRDKFRFSSEQLLNEGYVVWKEDHKIAIIFINISDKIPTKMHASNTCHNYRTDYLRGIYCKDKRHRLENSDMFFYNIEEMLILIRQDNKIYRPVRTLLTKFIKHKMFDKFR